MMALKRNSTPLLKSIVTFFFGMLVAIVIVLLATSVFADSYPGFVKNVKPYVQEKCCPCNDDESPHSSVE